MIKIGAKSVILNQPLLVPIGQDAWLTAVHGSDSIKLCIAIQDSVDPEGKPVQKVSASVNVEGKGDHAKVTLVDWHTPLALLASFILALVTTDPKTKALGLTGDTWTAIFVIVAGLAAFWLVRSLYRVRKCPTVADIIQRIKES